PLTTHRRPFCFNEFPARSPLNYFRIGVSSPHAPLCAIPRLLFIQGPHQRLLSPPPLQVRYWANGTMPLALCVVKICSRQAFQASMRRSSSTLSESSFRSSAPPGSGTRTHCLPRSLASACT